ATGLSARAHPGMVRPAPGPVISSVVGSRHGSQPLATRLGRGAVLPVAGGPWSLCTERAERHRGGRDLRARSAVMTEQNPMPIVVAVGDDSIDSALAFAAAEAVASGCGVHLLHAV